MNEYIEVKMEAKASEELRKEVQQELEAESKATASEAEEIIRRNTRAVRTTK
jgi:hypothetical protein